jgi:hypothetical protein
LLGCFIRSKMLLTMAGQRERREKAPGWFCPNTDEVWPGRRNEPICAYASLNIRWYGPKEGIEGVASAVRPPSTPLLLVR